MTMEYMSIATTLMGPMSQFVASNSDYLDAYAGVSMYLKSSISFDELSDVSTTYLGRKPIKWLDHFWTEKSFPIDADSYTIGWSPNGIKVNVLVDIGVSKCFMSKSFYLNNRCTNCSKLLLKLLVSW